MDLVSRVALGTVQFGLNYGINNRVGKVGINEIKELLSICELEGIDTLDTAAGYGKSEENLGRAGVDNFKIISKFPVDSVKGVDTVFQETLTKIRKQSLYAYLLHNFHIYKNNTSIWKDLESLKNEGKTEKIGISLYSPDELTEIWRNNMQLDIIQIPFNIFDRRFQPFFKELKERKIEIHARSSFLQGIVFKDPEKLGEHFTPFKKVLLQYRDTIEALSLSSVEACLGWSLSHSEIDKIVIGVDSVAQLESNLNTINSLSQKQINWNRFEQTRCDSEKFINPSLWK